MTHILKALRTKMSIRFLQQNKIDINNNDNFIFISPHLDDAVLSCGLLLSKLSELKKNVTIVTTFTKCTPKFPSPQAFEFVHACGYKSGPKLFADRIKEDIKAANLIQAKVVHLGFVDAAWRTDKNGIAIYTSDAAQFSGIVKSSDRKMPKKIQGRIMRLLRSLNNSVVLAPLSIGGHVDHVIVNRIIKKTPGEILFWQDQPYASNKNNLKEFSDKLKSYKLAFKINNGDYKTKEKLIRLYESQIDSLFKGNVPKTAEAYFSLKS